MSGLEGKVAIVTGAGRHRGLGKAIALRLARDGADIVIADLGRASGRHFPAGLVAETEEMQEVVADLQATGRRAMAIACDVREEAQVADLIARTVEAFGRLDILVNNAGIGYLMSLVTETDIADWNTVLAVNLTGTFLGIKHAARQMIAQGRGGRIVNIASQAGKSGFPYAAAYTASKHGVIGLTRSAAIELGPYGITVNAVCPNHVTTDLGAWQNEFFSKATGRTLEEYLAAMRQRIPLGRPGRQEDTANAVAFLCSEDAEYITGEALNVSGGEEMH
ncbi:MAG: SDR family NAD(P)-dependent oxidoreductase [Chloroflexota bacterium]|nr:SDR family oxidoreductase [Dehalococcoidia bacterium]MDW8254385.1 SDR family NAD(P)-dependent oxidoreductase [Chloroflexota bacterium]